MHETSIPDWVVERVARRQGAPLRHDGVPANRTALVVVDLQNYFMAPGEQGEVPQAREIVPNVNAVARALRAAGGIVAWVRTVFSEETLTSWSHFHTVMSLPKRDRIRTVALGVGSSGIDLWPGLDVCSDDLVVPKTRFSAFIHGSSSLESMLRKRGVEAVLVAGTMTNTCCDATARDAMLLDFRTTMITDANATITDIEHNAALLTFYLSFGDIVDTASLVRRYGALSTG